MIKDTINDAKSLVFFTGAGVSTDSGIPDFKTLDAGWKFPLSRERMISLSFFKQKPELFWEAYSYLFEGFKDLRPNGFHEWVSSLQSSHEVKVVTQNVDGLDVKAGTRTVIEIHGSVQKLVCLNKKCRRVFNRSAVASMPPVCSDCGRILKPDVVLFEEVLKDYNEAETVAAQADLLIVAGAALDVYPANLIPHNAMMRNPKLELMWANRTSPPPGYIFDHVFVGELKDFVKEVR